MALLKTRGIIWCSLMSLSSPVFLTQLTKLFKAAYSTRTRTEGSIKRKARAYRSQTMPQNKCKRQASLSWRK